MVLIIYCYIGYKYEATTWHLTGFPNGSNLGVKKKQNAPRASEHPPVRVGKVSKHLGGIKGCKCKTSTWHSNGGSPMEITLGQQYNVGEKPTVVIL